MSTTRRALSIVAVLLSATLVRAQEGEDVVDDGFVVQRYTVRFPSRICWIALVCVVCARDFLVFPNIIRGGITGMMVAHKKVHFPRFSLLKNHLTL